MLARPPYRPARVIRPDIAPGRRVLAISDIHGNLPFLRGVLAKAGFSKADVLVLIGDLLEKGEDSLGVLRYVMELSRSHTVYALCGNCDNLDVAFLSGRPGVDGRLWPVFRCWEDRSLVFQMGAELGLHPKSPEELPALRQALLERFPAECAFLNGMPHILEAGRYLFVHGGVPREDRLEELDAYSCMKNDDFLGQGLRFRRWVVVGHWPVTLYHPDINGDEMTYTAYDGLPVVRALDAQQASRDAVNIRWSDSAVEVLRREGDCAWCRHISSGREMWILNEYLYEGRDGVTHTEDTTDYLLPVAAGERLALVRRCSRGCIAKRRGETGWYRGRIEPAEH